jgi:fermentation-respiration switch protein FrsA (DUF1100 family)
MEVFKIVARNQKNKSKSLFIMSGTKDTMVPPEHALKVFEAFPGRK